MRRNNYRIQAVITGFDLLQIAKSVTRETVVAITGTIQPRKHDKNIIIDQLQTIEIQVTKIEVINRSIETPFLINSEINPSEKLAVGYRYITLRETKFNKLLKQRASQTQFIRNFFSTENFVEIDTPILAEPSNEGANEFYAPFVRGRQHQFGVYSLSQSPQIYKQLLMCGGIDRYFQIARCFRNEDLRNDRQPEFTQLDLEMAFTNPQDVQLLIEELICKLFLKFNQAVLPRPFKRMTYEKVINKYGTDQPDLRFNYKITHVRVSDSNNIEQSTVQQRNESEHNDKQSF